MKVGASSASRHALVISSMRCFGVAGAFLLLLLAEIFGFGVVGKAVLAPVVAHAGRKSEVMVAGVFLRDGAEFLPVVRELHGLALFACRCATRRHGSARGRA